MSARVVLPSLSTLALAGCSLFGIRSGYEQPRYDVVATLGDGVEVRRYGPRLAAQAVVRNEDEEAARNAAFKVLAAYIFGANAGDQQIAMTAPVAVGAGTEIAMTTPVAVTAPEAGQYAMRFFLPARYQLATAPTPTDPRVQLLEVPPETFAVLRFTGGTAPARVAQREADLRRALTGSDWRPLGEPVALFYDPPWTIPWLRRNEVAIPVARG